MRNRMNVKSTSYTHLVDSEFEKLMSAVLESSGR